METPQSKHLRVLQRPGFLALALLLLWASSAALAQGSPDRGTLSVLEGDGTVTRLVAGSYAELFPAGNTVEGETEVLVLERIDPLGDTIRWLVPETEGSDKEKPASLVLDDRSGAVFLLWETAINGLHPLLRLTRFEGDNFSSVVDITSGAFADKGTAQLVITREAENLRPVTVAGEVSSAEGEENPVETVVVHVVWWQESPLGSLKFYSPVVIENGILSQQAPILDLSRFAAPAAEGAGPEPETPAVLRDLLGIRLGETSQTVVLGYLEPDTRRLQTLRMDVVPAALSDLGDKFGAHIVIVGMRSRNYRKIAREVEPLVRDLAEDLHESVQLYMIARLEDMILNYEGPLTDDGLEILGERLNQEILTLTGGVETGGLARTDPEWVDATPRLEEGVRHVLMVRALSNRPMPEVGTPDGPVRFFLSGTGYHATVAWEQDGRVFFRETVEDGWGEVGSVEPTAGLETSAIYKMLEQRIANH